MLATLIAVLSSSISSKSTTEANTIITRALATAIR